MVIEEETVVFLLLNLTINSMNTSDLVKLESNKALKKDYLNKTPWWKTILIVPPICFLFIGLAGLLYLFKVEMLISLYAIPFVILFAIGTIWLKTLKRHIVNTSITAQGSFLTCASRSIHSDANHAYLVFVTTPQRHYEHYISKLVKSLTEEEISSITSQAGKYPVLLHNDEHDTDFYVKAFSLKEIRKQRKNWHEDDAVPLLFIDEKHVYVINTKYLPK